MHYPASDLVIDPVLIRKHDVSGPRYTSYPTADRFVEAFGAAELRQWLARRNIGGFAQPLSVYVHLPFCDTLCWYCGCNKIVTRDRGRSSQYIKYLEKEMALLAPLLGEERTIGQMHWGGGTPTFLSHEEMRALAGALDRTFRRSGDCECAVEVDPRSAPPGTMAFLAELGFNRTSLGVQDFDAQVQKAVHRVQSEEETRRVVGEARAAGFQSVNVDLIYGLPKQTLDSFDRTLDKVVALDPDRIALYSYAHLPRVFLPQRRIAEADLPSAETKLQTLSLAIGRLTRAGYLYIGMDHFARPDDELAVAQAQGRLQRNFQGYSTRRGYDLIGLGVSAIGSVGPTYYQNEKRLEDYQAALDAGRLPVARGMELSPDDLVRRAVIHALACHFRVSLESIELAHLVDFRKYFAAELEDLKRLEADGLVERRDDWIIVTAKGRLLVRVVCAVFDRYLREREARAQYSKVI
ncbi:MAG: oxygen-independent coproporphyrinogen III oxidase [Betaproteobacteria bacterium]|nr:oxygen-independent coproporphyrinogen III oxidase [Betaproteobacteria bacterium]MDH5221845.1 oxygen-independent coproporphyrinogen III oxidase [Betaproteobacteria bacterium]MDH5350120.1 oxygen-independent coproporphyrinogen III oxidase [Betaproteobacteria bacterium]